MTSRHIQAFYPSGGEMKPGKGLTIRREQATALRKALQAAEKAIREGGRATPGAADAEATDQQAA